MRLFGGSESRNAAARVNARVTRVSSGWAALLKNLREAEGQRILDIGPTSSTNINFLTGLGHSVYMANLVSEAANARWLPAEPDAPVAVGEFVEENLHFSGRHFDTVLFWDTGDYLLPALREAVLERLQQVMTPSGQLLAFFHIKPESEFHRYHLRDDGQIDVQYVADQPTGEGLNNRQIEKLFAGSSGHRFFLAKDNLREVLVRR